MTGRGIDQILQHPSNPILREPYVKNANRYVQLAENKNGPIPRNPPLDYIFGDALIGLSNFQPDVRIINLETSVTTSDDYLRYKGIHYRMNPKNIGYITTAGIDCCVLANNHLMDFDTSGLLETLSTLEQEGITYCGAGKNTVEARSPAIIKTKENCRVIIYSLGLPSSGVRSEWAATSEKPGVNFFTPSEELVVNIASSVREIKRTNDVVVVSLHWGSNWGYRIPLVHQELARDLIDDARVDVIYGHSSHHPKGMELYKGKLIMYGCGDFLNDYEGISGYEEYRDDLTLMYVPTLNAGTGKLEKMDLIPLRIKNFRLQFANEEETNHLYEIINRESINLSVERGFEKEWPTFEWMR